MTPPLPLATRLWPLLLLLVAWAGLLHGVHYYWLGDSTYNYGWFVFPFAGYFLYRAGRKAEWQLAGQLGPAATRMLAAALVGSILLVALFSLFHEAVPFWRRPLWNHSLVLFGLTLLLLCLLGGWGSLRSFAFPFAFLLLALPWPTRLEAAVIEPLTHLVVALTVLVVNLIGYPAAAAGNTIQVAGQLVGVDEACSGIRSLQSLIMMALFFGEMYRFGLVRRFSLLLGALVLAILFNGARAVTLTLVRVNGTTEQFDFWHEAVGNFTAVAASLLLVGVAELLVLLFKAPVETPVRLRWKSLPPRFTTVALPLAAVAFVAADAAPKLYFHFREAAAPAPLPALRFFWPDSPELSHESSAIPRASEDQLNFDFGEQVFLRWAGGQQAVVVHYGYRSESGGRVIDSYYHSPETCMPATGARQHGEAVAFPFNVYGATVQVRQYLFTRPGAAGRRPPAIHVFAFTWEPHLAGRDSGSGAAEAAEAAARVAALPSTWEAAWQGIRSGRRELSPEVVQVFFFSDEEPGRVRVRFTGLMQELLLLAWAESA